MTKKPKLISSIRAKLVSAVAMLLVAMIMVVSSTYAWFTLSTAPEVTGISTSIGANGALEMALNVGYADGPLDGTVESGKDENTYWGNLVDLDKAEYGLNKITLLPSQFVVAEDGKTFNAEGFLQTPVYGADGRVEELTPNAVTGKYTENSFIPSTDFGVRGLGTASGMTDRELAYRNAKSAASTAKGLAMSAASASLNANGSVLANVAIKHGTAEDGAAETYSYTDIQTMHNIFDSLLGADATKADGALEYIEQAYMQYILMYAASSAVADENTWTVVKGLVEADDATLEGVLADLSTNGVTLDSDVLTIMNKLVATKNTVATAKAKLPAVEDGKHDYAWTDFNEALGALVDTSALVVNNMTVPEIKADKDAFASTALGGITVTMKTGAGVYADIADHCGDYRASVKLTVDAMGMHLEDVPAAMVTKTTVTPTVYLDQVNTAMPSAPVSGNDATKPLTEFYGYIIDLSFRTNASNSNLLLQTAPQDRIYDDKTENNDAADPNNTWGHGSTMTFATTSTSFTTQQMKNLMKNIKIVFFTPGETNNILAYAVLDAENAKAATSGNGLTANIYLLADDGITMITEQEDADILALTQNATHNVSVLVYLDGTNLQNKDVAADASASMTGEMNLQFSSSANLVPMEYADLHPKAPAEGGDQTP